MAALTLLPLQFQRQDAVPIDIDTTFATTADRVAFLTAPRRYAGMIVADRELDQAFMLNDARDTWLSIASTPITVQDEGVTLTSTVTSFDFIGAGVTATNIGNAVSVTIPGGGGGGAALWEEQRITEAIPVVVPAENPYLFRDLFGGGVQSPINGHEPDVNFLGSNPEAAPTWLDEDYSSQTAIDSGGFFVSNSNLPIGEVRAVIGDGLAIYNNIQSFVITVLFRHPNIFIDEGDPSIEAFYLELLISDTTLTLIITQEEFGWSANFGGTIRNISAPTPNVDIPIVITITPIFQTMTIGSTIIDIVDNFATTVGLRFIRMGVAGGGYKVNSLTVTDPNAAPGRTDPGIVVDEIIPDPTLPPVTVPGGYERIQAVVLPEHELKIDVNPIIYESGILIKKLDFTAADHLPVDVVASASGTSFVYQNNADPSEFSSVHVARADYADLFSVTPPLALSFTASGVASRRFFLHAIDLDKAANGRAYYHGYLFETTNENPTAICVGCIRTTNNLPASATNPYSTFVWQMRIEGDFVQVSSSKTYVDGVGLIVGASDRISPSYHLFMIDFSTGAITWKQEIDTTNVVYNYDRLRLTTTTIPVPGFDEVFYVLYANTLSSFTASSGIRRLVRVLDELPGYSLAGDAGGLVGVIADPRNYRVIMIGNVDDGSYGIGYVFRLDAGNFTCYDTTIIDAPTSVSEFECNGDIILAKLTGVDHQIHIGKLYRTVTANPFISEAICLSATDLATIKINGLSIPYGSYNLTASGNTNIYASGTYPNGFHFGLIKGGLNGSAYDISIGDFTDVVGKTSSDGEWAVLPSSFGYFSQPAITNSAITMAVSTSALTATTSSVIAFENPPASPPWVETNPIIYKQSLGVLPRPAVKTEGITETGAFRLKNYINAPTSLIGKLNDTQGDIRFDDESLYYCIKDYDGVSDIWVSLSSSIIKYAQWTINCTIAAFFNSDSLGDFASSYRNYLGIESAVIPKLGTMALGPGYGNPMFFMADLPGFEILYNFTFALSLLSDASGAECVFEVSGTDAGNLNYLFKDNVKVTQIFTNPTKVQLSFNYLHLNSALPIYLIGTLLSGNDNSWAIAGDILITELKRRRL